jgi:hypothetical protein
MNKANKILIKGIKPKSKFNIIDFYLELSRENGRNLKV